MKKKLIQSGVMAAVAAISAIASSISPASAIPYNSSTVYKATETGTYGSRTVVFISGTPSSRVQVKLGASDRASARIAGACGEVRISAPSSGSFEGLKVDDTDVDASSLPVQTLPSCINGSFSEERSANFKTPAGQVVVVGKTAGSAVKIALPTESTRNVSINACGFGILRPSASVPLPETFMVGTENYTLASLPDATTGPICRTSGTSSNGFVPSTWAGN